MDKRREVQLYFGNEDYLIFDMTDDEIVELGQAKVSNGIFKFTGRDNEFFSIDTRKMLYFRFNREAA